MEKKECLVCKKLFEVKPSQAVYRKTCSKKCMALLYKERLKGEGNPHWKGGNVQKVCPTCGKRFFICLSKQNRKYCPKKCWVDSIRNKGRYTDQAGI